VNDPVKGDGKLHNAVVTPPGSGGQCEACSTDTPVQSFRVVKLTTATKATPGEKVTYTVKVTNTGQAAYIADAPASFTDDLSGVLDDATYNNDASSGATVKGNTLSWSGPLAVGASVTITYSVTVNDPVKGDGKLHNAVVTPPGSGGNCPKGSTDPACSVDVPPGVPAVVPPLPVDPALPAPPVVPPVIPAASSTGHLAYTGTDSSLEVALAGLLLSIGSLMVLSSRRRRKTN
jgi:uncharacterized repeat protein (TIGR01451 family)/LPXTG-motif cell wall-anchored protein